MPLSVAYTQLARVNCRTLFLHWISFARSRAEDSTGNSSAAKMAMMAMTTRSSIKVKPQAWLGLSRLFEAHSEFTRPSVRLRRVGRQDQEIYFLHHCGMRTDEAAGVQRACPLARAWAGVRPSAGVWGRRESPTARMAARRNDVAFSQENFG